VVLVDTSVWVNHLRRGDDALAQTLLAGEVACHPFVIGELACGSIANRRGFLSLLSALPALAKLQNAEVLTFIDHHRLMGKGLGLIDVHLLASCMLARATLWTGDGRLAGAAAHLGCAHVPGAARGD